MLRMWSASLYGRRTFRIGSRSSSARTRPTRSASWWMAPMPPHGMASTRSAVSYRIVLAESSMPRGRGARPPFCAFSRRPIFFALFRSHFCRLFFMKASGWVLVFAKQQTPEGLRLIPHGRRIPHREGDDTVMVTSPSAQRPLSLVSMAASRPSRERSSAISASVARPRRPRASTHAAASHASARAPRSRWARSAPLRAAPSLSWRNAD